MYKRFLIIGLSLATVSMLLLMSFNWFFNPHGIFTSVTVEDLNLIKPKWGAFERQQKAYRVSRLRPTGVVLGTSRPDVGLDPDHPGWSAQPTYNLALGQASTYTTYRFFLHADFFAALDQVVLGLDFEMFMPGVMDTPVDQNLSLVVDENNRRDPDYFGLLAFQGLTSITSVRDSIEVLKANRAARGTPAATNYSPVTRPNGMLNLERVGLGDSRTRHQIFLAYVQDMISPLWTSPDKFRELGNDSSNPAIAYFRKTLAAAYERDVDLYMVIPPTHVYLNEAMAVVGLWDAMERWRRTIVKINLEEAVRAEHTPFPIWDFWGYNSVSTKAVPRIRAQPTDMHGYWDPSHIKKFVGDRILNKVFAVGDERVADPDFGILLNDVDLEAHLANIRRQRETYRVANPELVAEIAAMMQHDMTK